MNIKRVFLLLVLIFSFFIFSPKAQAEERINLYFFYGNGCPHCVKEEKFLDRLEKENNAVNIFRYEVWNNRDNAALLARIGKELNLEIKGVPLLIVGEETIVGYYNDAVTGKRINEIISNYLIEGCTDPVAEIMGESSNIDECVHGCDEGDEECLHNCGCSADTEIKNKAPSSIVLPFLGEVDIKNVSLPLFTFLIAATDGFNPCAMWILLFLISLLIGMKDKRRMWILGSAFIITSGAVYFLFLSAWLNLFLFLGFVFWIRVLVGVVALASGSWHLYDAWKNRDGGCHVTSSEKRQRVFARIKKITLEEKFYLAFLGIILLAVAVNLVELVCSAGLPAVYTQVLALSNLPTWQHYGYLLFYVLIFMLDDLLVFFVAMATLQMKALSSHFTRWSGLVGGIIMLLIGLLLLFKPGWLMFG